VYKKARMAECVLCGKVKEGKFLHGETTVDLWVCKTCIKQFGEKECKHLLDRL